MANYVDGDAMLRELERMIEPEAEDDYNKGWNNAIATVIDVMGMVYRLTDPDIVKHGLWGLRSYEIGGRTYRRWECPFCDLALGADWWTTPTQYCPQCGAELEVMEDV